MSFKVTREEIATALKSINGLNVTPYRPSPIMPTPCAFIVPNNILYGYTLPRQNQKTYFDIQLLVGRVKDLQDSQSELDEYLDYTGDKSIKSAVESGTYTGLSAVKVISMLQYGGFLIDDTPYWGAVLRVETY